MLTVLLATRNRAALLSRVLEAYTSLRAPAGGWKLVVVNNGSTDQTDAVLASYRDRLPLTMLSEPRIGKNRALTTGLEAIAGDVVVFTDDDAFPRADWLTRVRDAVDAHPAHAIFGGVVRPRWEQAPADWVLNWVLLGPVFSLTSPTLVEGPTAAHNVFGPNMAVRSEVFARGLGFDTTIGPRGPSYAMGSETEFVRRLIRAGYAAWHVQGAVVEHHIGAAQLSARWILSRAVRFGRGQYRLDHASGAAPPSTTWLGVPRYLVNEMLRYVGAMVHGVLTLNGERLFRARWDFHTTRGRALEARDLHRAQRRMTPELAP